MLSHLTPDLRAVSIQIGPRRGFKKKALTQNRRSPHSLSHQMAGLQVGRKIYTINEDLLFLRPLAEVETMISQAFCIRRSLRLLVATKAKE